MTPQSSFMVLAPVTEGRVDELRALLASMNLRPGRGRPGQRAGAVRPVRPAARRALRRARGADRGRHRGLRPAAPSPGRRRWCSSATATARPTASCTTSPSAPAPGLRRIFAHCRGFSPNVDLLAWMKRHERPSAANYVNWIGRTVRQVREEQALHAALLDAPARTAPRWRRASCRAPCATGWLAFVDDRAAGRPPHAHAAGADARRLAPAQHAACRRRAGRAPGAGAVPAPRLAGR